MCKGTHCRCQCAYLENAVLSLCPLQARQSRSDCWMSCKKSFETYCPSGMNSLSIAIIKALRIDGGSSKVSKEKPIPSHSGWTTHEPPLWRWHRQLRKPVTFSGFILWGPEAHIEPLGPNANRSYSVPLTHPVSGHLRSSVDWWGQTLIRTPWHLWRML